MKLQLPNIFNMTENNEVKSNIKVCLWIARVLMAGYAIFAADRIFRIFTGQNILISSITLIFSLLSAFVFYRVQATIKAASFNKAALWMMASNIVLIFIIQATDAGNSPLTGATIGLVNAVIASQMLSDRWSAIGIFFSFAGGAVIATLDYVLPGTGGGLDFKSVSLYLLLVIDVVFLWFLLRPFASYQMNVKFLLSMTILTIAAAVFTFTPTFLVILNSSSSSDSTLLMNVQRAAVISGAVFVVISGVVSFLIARYISRPLVRMISSVQAIGKSGDLTQTFEANQQGEVSYLAHALNSMSSYFRQLSEAAQKVSQGDLTISITPRSHQDILGVSFSQMIESLRQLVQVISENAQSLSSASDHLRMVVDNSEKVIDTILEAVQQVIAQRGEGSSDSASFEQLARAIENIARGAQEQAGAVSKAANYSTQIASFVQQVSDNMNAVKSQTADTARNAQNGAQVMQKMVEEIENIRDRVSQSAEKVSEMGERSKQIEDIVSSIGSIASQTNLLALNTAIEAARSTAHTNAMAERILDSTMIAQAWLVAHLLNNNKEDFDSDRYWEDLAKQCHLDNINVTDGDAVVVYTNESWKIGLRWSEDPKAQTYAFRQLLDKPGSYVCQPLQKRTVDDKHFKYVGVCRLDAPGVIQVGFDGSSIEKYKSGGGVFSVISEEILELAKQTQLATKEIIELNQSIQKSVSEAVTSMVEGEQEVESGVSQAAQAREALNTIMSGTEAIEQQVLQAAQSVDNVEQVTRELSESMDSVSAVVEQNTAATEEMAASTNEVSESIRAIADLAHNMTGDMQNIVSAVQSLADNVLNSQEVVKRFKIKENEMPD